MHYLMGTDRYGLQGSQFTFQFFDEDHPRSGAMLRSEQDGMLVPRAQYDKRSIVDIDHPLAQIIKQLPELCSSASELKALVKAAAPGLRQALCIDDQHRALARQSLAPAEREAIEGLLGLVSGGPS
jgi:hypothetical protein